MDILFQLKEDMKNGLQATIKLISELNKERKSGEEKGWLSHEDVKAHFIGKAYEQTVLFTRSLK